MEHNVKMLTVQRVSERCLTRIRGVLQHHFILCAEPNWRKFCWVEEFYEMMFKRQGGAMLRFREQALRSIFFFTWLILSRRSSFCGQVLDLRDNWFLSTLAYQQFSLLSSSKQGQLKKRSIWCVVRTWLPWPWSYWPWLPGRQEMT